MRYSGLTKLGKKAFCVNFTLLDKLKITTKEAILLQQIEFVNKKSDFLVLPLTILSTITNMSRGHLYRCLNKLKKIGLIVVTDEGIAITDYYKEIREQDFLENHNKNKALQQKMAKKSQSVACEKEALRANDEFYYTQYRCNDMRVQDVVLYGEYGNTSYIGYDRQNDRCFAYAQHDKRGNKQTK